MTVGLVRSLLVAEWSIVADFIRTPNGIPPFAASHKISRPSSRQYGGGGADLYHPRNNPILNTFNTNIRTFQILSNNHNRWWLANWSLSIFSLNTGLIFIGAAAAASDQTRDGWRTQCGLPGAGLINSLVSSCLYATGMKVKERHCLLKSGEAREAQTS